MGLVLKDAVTNGSLVDVVDVIIAIRRLSGSSVFRTLSMCIA
ncbi:MAG: hypothetical protein QXW47_06565 [Candidatus Jordarchaeales archaeon]